MLRIYHFLNLLGDPASLQLKFKYLDESKNMSQLEFDIMVSLSPRLDRKSLSEKMSYIWNEWSGRNNFFDLNSKGSFLFKLVLWGLR